MDERVTVRADRKKIGIVIVISVLIAVMYLQDLRKFVVATNCTGFHLASFEELCPDFLCHCKVLKVEGVSARSGAIVVLAGFLDVFVFSAEGFVAVGTSKLNEFPLAYADALSGAIVAIPLFYGRRSPVKSFSAYKAFSPGSLQWSFSNGSVFPFVDLGTRPRAEDGPFSDFFLGNISTKELFRAC